MASVERHSEFAGTGCAVQAVGLLSPFVLMLLGPAGFVVGCVAAVVLLAVGSRMSLKLRCSACKNPVASKSVTVCPACSADLR